MNKFIFLLLLLPGILQAQNLRLAILPYKSWCDVTKANAGYWPNCLNDHYRTITEKQIKHIKYLEKLGYTHVVVPLDFHGLKLSWKTPPESWQYIGGTSSYTYHSFNNARKIIEKIGLKIIPSWPNISHMNRFIKADPDLRFGPLPAEPQKPSTAILGRNSQVIFNEILYKIVGILFKSSPPEFVHIGLDELQFYTGSNTNNGRDMANAIAAYVYAVRHKPGWKKVRVIAWGDTFLPADRGQESGLIGTYRRDKKGKWTGSGGVMEYLAAKGPEILKPLVLMPWIYSITDGNPHPAFSGTQIVNKEAQISYLDHFKVQYIPVTGEDASLQAPAYSLNPVREPLILQTTYEWFKWAYRYPDRLLGFAHGTWTLGYDICREHSGEKYCIDYTAAAVTYLMQYPQLARGPSADNYDPDVFKGLNHKLSRNQGEWKKGIHYRAP